ncbi:PH domain-containing protein [Aquibacillus rhizosphaerae]|uniref:PH domain-containing protein n=1 Tax=Aquibacillus rhizosphaerae TaxID=3051431 RepID=A0ABT7L6Z8_9BACI|nr:PH domain-containing protein [Aquibacillus sp. LR5S19]MDL4840982.1 PH domain-containing protein [Aquibacillus sp. LR5S19]
MRYHPLTMVFKIYHLVKNSLLFALILFVFQRNSEFWLYEYGRYAFVFMFVWRLVYIVIAWIFERYEWEGRTFHLHKGIFVKHTSTIPFSKIQNVTRKTGIIHKIFGHTSLTFETAMDGEDDAIHFEVLTKKHANYLLDLVKPGETTIPDEVHKEAKPLDESVDEYADKQEKDRTIHFTPMRKDLWKASFTSLSFLAILPFIGGAYDYFEPFLPETDQVEGLFQRLLANAWLFLGIIVLAVIVAVVFGMVRTFIRYGKYEISSDATYIYIDRGVLDESYFSIEKRKVQGLEINQTWIRRIFGLAEVKLISTANPNMENGAVNVNSLYPFLPIEKAYQLIEDLLPVYQLDVELARLPRKSLWIKLLRPSWLWILATIGLFYFKPDFLQIDQAWWILSLGLLCIIVLNRILDYLHTRYAVTSDQVQWWHGGITSRMFITKRKNVIEMSYSQTRLQKHFQVASVSTINRSVPAHIEIINDIPLTYARVIQDWYLKRQEDIRIDKEAN